MYNLTKVDDDANLMVLKTALPNKVFQDIISHRIISVINWDPEYRKIIEAKDHTKMLKIIKSVYRKVDVRTNNLLLVYEIFTSKHGRQIAYVWSPIDLWDNNHLILLDRYPDNW